MAHKRLEADVCVVGAGYSGLTAARRLTGGGRSVVVLEARDRIGGRIWSYQLGDGSVVDRGGAWLAPKHDAMFGLAAEVGVPTYKTYVKGAHLLVEPDRILRYSGLIPRISPLAVVSIAMAQLRIDLLARLVTAETPWTSPLASTWDRRSVGSFVKRSRVQTKIGRDLFEMAVRGLFGTDLDNVSLLHLLQLVRGHGSINTLFSIEGGSQENMITGGAGAVAQRIVEQLGNAVILEAPVHSVTQTADRAVVEAAGVTVSARDVVVSTPPALALRIAFDPPLAADRQTLYRSAGTGVESKTLVVYDAPFWRDDGFSGQSAEPQSAAEVTLDGSPPSGLPGVLASFCFGPAAEKLHSIDEEGRRQAILDALVKRFGPKAASPSEVISTAWWTEQWSLGCSFAHLPPGVLTRYGKLLRQPFGRVHWAGTETSGRSHGAIDGAVRSGERVATEILEG